MKTRGRTFREWIFFFAIGSCFALLAVGGVFLLAAPPESQNSPLILELKLDQEIEPVLATYMTRASPTPPAGTPRWS